MTKLAVRSVNVIVGLAGMQCSAAMHNRPSAMPDAADGRLLPHGELQLSSSSTSDGVPAQRPAAAPASTSAQTAVAADVRKRVAELQPSCDSCCCINKEATEKFVSDIKKKVGQVDCGSSVGANLRGAVNKCQKIDCRSCASGSNLVDAMRRLRRPKGKAEEGSSPEEEDNYALLAGMQNPIYGNWLAGGLYDADGNGGSQVWTSHGLSPKKCTVTWKKEEDRINFRVALHGSGVYTMSLPAAKFEGCDPGVSIRKSLRYDPDRRGFCITPRQWGNYDTARAVCMAGVATLLGEWNRDKSKDPGFFS